MKNIYFFALLLLLFSCSKSAEMQIMSKIVEKYNSERTQTPFVSKVYFSEYSKQGDNYISFNDGIYYFISYGEDVRVPVGNFALISENVRKVTSKDEYLSYTNDITARYIESSDDYVNLENISELSDIPMGHGIYNIVRRFELSGPLSKNGYKKYEYKIDSSDNKLPLKFESSGAKSSLKGLMYYNTSTFSIDSINVVAQNYEVITNEFELAKYTILFEDDGRIKSVKIKSTAKDLDITRNLKFIAGTQKDFDVGKFNTDRSYNTLILYDSSDFNNYAQYFDDEYNSIFDSFGGIEKVNADFAAKNNTLFLYKNFQNKSEEYENRSRLVDSTLRNVLDSLYGVKRVSYTYNEPVRPVVYKPTDLEILSRVADIGTVENGTIVSADFKVINTGEEALYISDINPDSDNISYSLNRNGVAPLDTITVTLKYDTKGKIGKNGSIVSFKANSKDKMHRISILVDIKE